LSLKWVDVSDKVSAEMNGIWRSEYGQWWVEWKVCHVLCGWLNYPLTSTQEIGQAIAVAKNQKELTIRVLDIQGGMWASMGHHLVPTPFSLNMC
jgi:hypothetical protein